MRPSAYRTALRRAAWLCILACAPGCTTQTVQLSVAERVGLTERSLRLLVQAARSEEPDLRANAIEALTRVAPDDSLPTVRDALRADSPLVRYAACVALGELEDALSGEAIQKRLRDANAHVQLGAAFAAYRLGDTDAGRVLVNGLTGSPDENVRADAADLIGRLREPRSLRRLRFALDDDSNKVRVHVLGALARLDDEDALDRLIQYAQGDLPTRTAALLVLADLANAAAVDALRYRLGPAEDYLEVRLIAARGLGKLGMADGLELALSAAQYDSADSAGDPQQRDAIRSLAAHALAEIGDERALPVLRRLAESDNDPRLQVAACYAICKIIQRRSLTANGTP